MQIALLSAGDEVVVTALKDVLSVVVCYNECGALRAARSLGLPHVLVPLNDNREDHERQLLAALEPYAVDYVFLSSYGRLLSSIFLAAYPDKVFNAHPSLLPAYPGPHGEVFKAQLRDKVTRSGVTIHRVDEGMDTGAIVMQKQIAIKVGDSVKDLYNRAQEIEIVLWKQLVKRQLVPLAPSL